MKFENKFNLPEEFTAIIDAHTRRYDKGKSDYSVTQLIDSPRVVNLREKNKKKIVADYSDMIAATTGSSFHHILEESNETIKHFIVEKRFFQSVNGIIISGAADIYNKKTKIIGDYKTCSVWQHGKLKDEWIQQLNILAWLANKEGYKVKGLKIFKIFKDWKKSMSERSENYPKCQLEVSDVELWDLEDTEDFIKQRIKLHEDVRKGKEYLCTEEDTWYSGDSWAVKKKGGKKAIRVLHVEPKEVEEGYEIEFRKGVHKRCEDYCSVSLFCDQYNNRKTWD